MSKPLPSALSTQSVTVSDSGLVNVTCTLAALCTTVGPMTYREKTFCSVTALVTLLCHGFLFSFVLQTAYLLRISWIGRSQGLIHVSMYFQAPVQSLTQPSSMAEEQQPTVESTVQSFLTRPEYGVTYYVVYNTYEE